MKRVHVLVLAFVCVLGTSCASFRADGLRGPESLKAGQPPKSLRVLVTGKTSINGKDGDAPPVLLSAWTKSALDVYTKSALFSSVETGPGDADLRAEVSLDSGGDANFALAFLSGFTFLVIPAYAVDRITVNTRFIDRSGRVLGSYDKQVEMKTWFHLFMIPVMPFKFPAPVANGMFADIHRSTLDDAIKAGVL